MERVVLYSREFGFFVNPGDNPGSFTRVVLEKAERLDPAQACQAVEAINQGSNIDAIALLEHEAQQLNIGARQHPELDDEEAALF